MPPNIKKIRVKIEIELLTEEWKELIDACHLCELGYKTPKMPGYEKMKIRKKRLRSLKRLRIARGKIEKAFQVADITTRNGP